jgi:hypothetical protein
MKRLHTKHKRIDPGKQRFERAAARPDAVSSRTAREA